MLDVHKGYLLHSGNLNYQNNTIILCRCKPLTHYCYCCYGKVVRDTGGTNRKWVKRVDVLVDVEVDDSCDINTASTTSVRLSRVDADTGVHLDRFQRLATIYQLPHLHSFTSGDTRICGLRFVYVTFTCAAKGNRTEQNIHELSAWM